MGRHLHYSAVTLMLLGATGTPFPPYETIPLGGNCSGPQYPATGPDLSNDCAHGLVCVQSAQVGPVSFLGVCSQAPLPLGAHCATQRESCGYRQFCLHDGTAAGDGDACTALKGAGEYCQLNGDGSDWCDLGLKCNVTGYSPAPNGKCSA